MAHAVDTEEAATKMDRPKARRLAKMLNRARARTEYFEVKRSGSEWVVTHNEETLAGPTLLGFLKL